MTGYEIKKGTGFFKYMVYFNDWPVWPYATMRGAKRKIKRDKARRAKSMRKQARWKPDAVVYKEKA